ncbi:hypothetical protein LEMLEM_LOCUS15254, partial [Lemmus lemmus]
MLFIPYISSLGDHGHNLCALCPCLTQSMESLVPQSLLLCQA